MNVLGDVGGGGEGATLFGFFGSPPALEDCLVSSRRWFSHVSKGIGAKNRIGQSPHTLERCSASSRQMPTMASKARAAPINRRRRLAPPIEGDGDSGVGVWFIIDVAPGCFRGLCVILFVIGFVLDVPGLVG